MKTLNTNRIDHPNSNVSNKWTDDAHCTEAKAQEKFIFLNIYLSSLNAWPSTRVFALLFFAIGNQYKPLPSSRALNRALTRDSSKGLTKLNWSLPPAEGSFVTLTHNTIRPTGSCQIQIFAYGTRSIAPRGRIKRAFDKTNLQIFLDFGFLNFFNFFFFSERGIF